MTTPNDLVYDAFYEQTKAEQKMILSGIGHYHYDPDYECDEEECAGLAPLIGMEEALDEAAGSITYLRNHKHTWNENLFCWCGWDGNA